MKSLGTTTTSKPNFYYIVCIYIYIYIYRLAPKKKWGLISANHDIFSLKLTREWNEMSHQKIIYVHDDKQILK